MNDDATLEGERRGLTRALGALARTLRKAPAAKAPGSDAPPARPIRRDAAGTVAAFSWDGFAEAAPSSVAPTRTEAAPAEPEAPAPAKASRQVTTDRVLGGFQWD